MKTEDHSLSALIVKEDGLIYVNRVPEEPELCFILDKKLNPDVSLGHVSCDILGCQCDVEQEQYQKALASAKESAIKCADQEKAKAILLQHCSFFNLKLNKVYPIPDLQWEVDDQRLPHYPKVAILHSPSTEKEESQDELWKQARHLIEIWDIDGLFKQFIITRKP